jgi:thioredoxin 1
MEGTTMATTDITLQNFETLLKDHEMVVIDAWANWCGPCRAFAPVFEAASARHPDAVWGKLDTEQQNELASAFGIRSIPTLMLFRQGVLLFQQAGMLPAHALDDLMQKARALDMDTVRQKIAEHERAQAKRSA